jgi:3-hydroxybutyryl-CoA dehydrogenase
VASKADIDLSMKLGTNYPFGPFEWADRIGVDKLRKLLLAIQLETGDSRYVPTF